MAKECQSVVSDSCDPMACSLSVHRILQATGVGSHSLLQGIFPTQGWNSGFLHRRQTL